MYREELFRLLTIRYNIQFQAEEVQKTGQVIHRVHITDHHQAANLPVLYPEVPIHQGLLRVLLQVLHLQVLHLHLILHQAGDSLK
jgi:hypothetical protein